MVLLNISLSWSCHAPLLPTLNTNTHPACTSKLIQSPLDFYFSQDEAEQFFFSVRPFFNDSSLFSNIGVVCTVQQAAFHLYSNWRERINIASNKGLEMASSSCPFPEQSEPALPLLWAQVLLLVWAVQGFGCSRCSFKAPWKEQQPLQFLPPERSAGSGWPTDLGWTLEERGRSLAFVLEKWWIIFLAGEVESWPTWRKVHLVTYFHLECLVL